MPLANKNSSGCLILFSLPFAAVGIGMAVWNCMTVLKHGEMRSWAEAPATIKRAELKVDHDGDGGTTYEAVADYEYDFQGQHFTGHRISIHGGSDNVGSFQHDAYRELKAHLDQKQPFHCYINPASPADAVLYRDLRGEMVLFTTLFACVFGSAGLGLLTGAIVASRQSAGLAHDGPADSTMENASRLGRRIRRSSGRRARHLAGPGHGDAVLVVRLSAGRHYVSRLVDTEPRDLEMAAVYSSVHYRSLDLAERVSIFPSAKIRGLDFSAGG